MSGSILRFWGGLAEIELSYAELRNCNFESSHIQSSSFDFADLSGAIFKKTRLAGNSFIAANLSDANFEGAYLYESV
ncbi:MAG: pentapeptide repeat-containing protein [Nostocaceae cyanobacterium]|nr:pentapeptide repeat-containing protein [Nostocaceae cyanobacterium]